MPAMTTSLAKRSGSAVAVVRRWGRSLAGAAWGALEALLGPARCPYCGEVVHETETCTKRNWS